MVDKTYTSPGLWEETHIQEVVGSNPSIGYWMNICSHCIVFLKTPKVNEKEAVDGPLKIKLLHTLSYNLHFTLVK